VAELRTLLGIVSSDLMATCTRSVTGRDIVLSGFFSSVGIWPHQEVTPDMIESANRAIALMEVSHLAERDTDEMSSGEARRILMARALVHHPRALLLDEPSTALDLFAQHELRQILRKLAQSGIGIIMVTHHLSDLIPEMERVILMDKGCVIADGPTREVLTAPRLSARRPAASSTAASTAPVPGHGPSGMGNVRSRLRPISSAPRITACAAILSSR